MSLGLYENRQRQRAKRRWATIKFVFVLLLFGAIAAVSYDLGAKRGGDRIAELTAGLESANSRLANLQASEEEAQEIAAGARDEAAAWEARYRDDVPEGFFKEMLDRIRAKREEGVSEERLTFLIEAARKVESCDEGAATKRFIVRTPLSKGANDSVAFGDGLLTVTASGPSARDANGNPEAWFDPDKEITLTVTSLGGEEQTASGLLPLHHAMVAGGREYRFTARAGGRGFLEVTGSSCAFP